jgi:multiple sugar transport system permease protein
MTHAPTPDAPRRRPRDQESRVGRIAAMSVLVVLTIYFLIPVYFLLVSSTKSQGDFVSTFGLWFAHLNFTDNLRTLFTTQDGVFGRWAANSLIYAGGGALIGTFLSALTGYALAKFRFRGRNFLFSVILSGVLVPSATLALPLFLMFSAVHQVNTYWSVILPSVVNPFGVFLARVFTSAAVPDEILESARIDGASEFRIFRQVSLRLLAPSLVTIFLFQFIGIWNNFFLPMVMLQSQKLYPITLGLFNWNAAVNQQPDLQQSIITGSFVSIVPLIVLFLLLQHFWKTGLSAGAIK